MQWRHRFTFLEWTVMLAILGILASIAVPRFANLPEDRVRALQHSLPRAVRSAHAHAVQELHRFPAVSELADGLRRHDIYPVREGVGMDLAEYSFVVPTYVDAGCTKPTTDIDNTVRCVGNFKRL